MEIYLGDWSELKRTRAVSFIYNARIRVKNLEFNFKLEREMGNQCCNPNLLEESGKNNMDLLKSNNQTSSGAQHANRRAALVLMIQTAMRRYLARRRVESLRQSVRVGEHPGQIDQEGNYSNRIVEAKLRELGDFRPPKRSTETLKKLITVEVQARSK